MSSAHISQRETERNEGKSDDNCSWWREKSKFEPDINYVKCKKVVKNFTIPSYDLGQFKAMIKKVARGS